MKTALTTVEIPKNKADPVCFMLVLEIKQQ